MIHLFKSAVARTVTFALVGVIVVGLLIGVVRVSLPFADLFRSQVEALLEETLGLDARVGRFGLRLAGWIPRLTLEDVELWDPGSGRSQLALKALSIDLDLAASAAQLSPQVEALTLVGAHLVARRRPDGSISIAGLEGIEGGNPQIMHFFLANGRFLLTDSEILWVDEGANAAPLHLSQVRLRFDNTGSRHRIGLLARLFDDPKADVHLAADLMGAPGQPREWDGDIYLRVNGRDLQPLLSGYLPAGHHVGSNALRIESWNRIADSNLVHSLNRIAADGLVAWREVPDGGPAPWRLDRLTALLGWERDDEGWQLDVANLRMKARDRELPPASLALRYAPASGGDWTLSGRTTGLDLGQIAAALEQVPDLPPPIVRVRDARLEGVLEDLRFRVDKRMREGARWLVDGRVTDLGLEAEEQIPGIRGLDLRFSASNSAGRLALSSDELTFVQPALFSSPIQFDRVEGDLSWHLDALGRLQFESSSLEAENADISIRSRLGLMLPNDGGLPFLDLHAHFSDGDVASVRRYLPTGRLKAKLSHWLDRAFVSGRIPSGTLLFRGNLADFPFDNREGRFEILFGVEDTILDFHPRWPRLEEIIAEVRFENRGMEVKASSARLLDSEVLYATARIPNLFAAKAVEIQGKAEGPFSDGLRILAETPLEKRLGPVARAVRVDGRFRVDLQRLDVPLRHNGVLGPLHVEGEISWPDDAGLSLARWEPLRLEGLRGGISFTQSGVYSESVEAQLWGQPVALRIATDEGEDGTGGSTRIQAEGEMPAEILAPHFPSPLWDLVAGRAKLDLEVQIENADIGRSTVPLAFSLESPLAGVALDLPHPVGKDRASTRHLHMEGQLIPGGDLDARGRYGELGVDLHFSRDDHGALRLVGANLNLEGAAERVRGEGLRLEGNVASLDVGPWLDWVGSRQAADSGKGGGVALQSVDLKARRLRFRKLGLSEAQLSLKRAPGRWEARVETRELAGDIRIPHRARSEPLRIHLERLDLARLLPQGEKIGRSADVSKGSADPRRIHTFELGIDRLLWADNMLGSVSIGSRQTPGGMEFSPIRVSGELMSVEGTGRWIVDGTGQHTQVNVEAKSDDLGELLRRLQYESVIHEAPANADLRLEWTGGPTDVSAKTLAGKIEVDVGKGSLLDVEPGVGRMLGILNLGALQRRLSLDFTDLFERGFAFEQMTGKLTVANGRATIEDMAIDGPSAKVDIGGSTDLVAQEFNQVVTVTPRIGTGVALASAVAGGPLVGAAVFIADKVAGDAVDKLGRYQYDVTGPWVDPVFRRRGIGGEAGGAQTFLPEHGRAGAQRTTSEKPRAANRDERAQAGPRKAPDKRPKATEENLFLDGF